MLRFLRQAGVDLDATTEGNDGRTAICTAAAEGNTDVVVTLGAAGADFEMRFTSGDSAMNWPDRSNRRS